ncbi:MAG: TrbC family F-type conjugative pilus assembly protein [Candidatus Thiodiazotropha endolucinida]|nr:conjugal transfer protein TraW [Candidatus Thiodiazotropha taylori]MCW4249649.1 TrbC family F-type conjugative pilus assembly protein [Candidatus Thiodiazotropha endolucinida]MCG7883037.1 conjugal transfer protein TraW [Candidatus Thiodiazotropha taylori]MCG8058679.1 conjugal transfer protein TraW [Candidatus Thiodiazotropha taylori]MCG8104617.1 conjugal transfer protein TraW [Candidatus Thiodiazotropha taylori]
MKISSVVHIHCFKALMLLALCLSGTLVWAQGNVLTPEDEAIAKMAKTIKEQSKDWEIPVNEHQEAAKAQAAQLFTELQKQTSEQLNLPEKQKPSGRVMFFVSHSLGKEGLDEVLYTASVTPDSMVVFRGLKDEKNFAKSVLEIQNHAAKQTPMANVVLDPTLFRDYAVSKVPTIVYLDEGKTNEVARVSGLSTPGWLLEKVKAGKSGDFGVRGPVEDILERDLIEVMQDKVAAIDWADKKEQAIKRFWEKQQFIELPRANKPRRRYLDPSILISDDIKDVDGKVLVARGTKINPLELKPFTQAVVVFDPLDAKQLALVDKQLPDLIKNHPRVTLIVTRFDRAEGWESYKTITDHFDAPVYKLTQDIYSRFDLEYAPAVITAQQNHFVIDELAPSDEEAP